MKKIITLILIICMVIGMLPVTALAADVVLTFGGNVTGTLNTTTGELIISGTGNMNFFSSTTTPTRNYQADIKTVVIQSGVTDIKDCVFYNCSAMTSITIPNSVRSIGPTAFYGCSSLTSVTIPDAVTSIANSTFMMCSGLTSVTLPSNLITIGNLAFVGCSSLSSIFIPNSVTSIGNDAFRDCSSLSSITIPSGVTLINDATFQNCTSLSSVTIPSGVTRIGTYAFYSCRNLISFTIPNSVTSIGNGTFVGCTGLTSITIPDSVTSMGNGVFNGCTGLTTVTIPSGLSSIGATCFAGCTNLTTIINNYDGVQTIGLNAFNNVGSSSSTKNAYLWSSNTSYASTIATLGFTLNYFSKATIIAPEGTSFTIKNSIGDTLKFINTADEYTVDVSGSETVTVSSTCSVAVLELPTGTYTIVPNAVDGFITPSTFTITENGNATITYTANSVAVTAPAGSTFTVSDSIGNAVKFTDTPLGYTVDVSGSSNVTVGAAGIVDLKQLLAGMYTITPGELNGYKTPSPKTVTENGTVIIPYPSNLATITAPSGSSFTVKDGSGNTIKFKSVVGDYVVDSAGNETVIVGHPGTARLLKLPVGTYTITPAAFTGYVTPSAATVTENGTATLTYTEEPKTDPTPEEPKPEPTPTPVTISCTKTDATLYGGANGSIIITAAGGDSGAFEYSKDGGVSWQGTSTFTSVPAGTYKVMARDAGNTLNTASTSVSISQPPHVGSYVANKVPTKANAETALTVIPPAAPKGYTVQSVSYSSNNPSIAAVDSNGNVTFLTGGKATVITKIVSQTMDKKGRIKIKTTTVKKTITVKQPVSGIALNVTGTTMARTQKVKLVATIAPGTASIKKVKWTTSNKKVATVSSAGVVTGKTGGTAIITCTATDGSGMSASCIVNVTPIYPVSIKLSKTALTIKVGKTSALKATVMPKNTDFKMVTWISSDPEIVTVDAKGKLRGIAPGMAVITAMTSTGQRSSCTIIVK